jgi:hypothetical protein
MRVKASPVGLLTLTAALFVLAFAASPARAAFGVDEWQSLTCTENEDIPPFGEETPAQEPPLPEGEPCTKETSLKWFKQAAGHPPFGITDLILNTLSGPGAEGFPDGFVKDIIVETPEGLSVNPEALAKCSLEQAEANIFGCPSQTIVGTNYLTAATEAPGADCVPKCEQKRVAAPVYNVEPFFGHPSMVAFPNSAGEAVYIVGSLDPADQHVNFTISDIESPLEGGAPLVRTRLVFDEGEAALGPGLRFGNGTYLTLPSECGSSADATVKVDSHKGASGEKAFSSPYIGEGCDAVPFDPTIDVSVDSQTDSPEPATVDIGIPFDSEDEIANSYLKTATVTLPDGAGINPSLANGLETCTDAQFKYHTDDPIECPDASKIGTTEVQTPSLPPNSLFGTVYAAQPLNNEPTSGNQFRIFLTVGSERYGVNVRLIGHVFPNLKTGQLKIVVDENPQATFSSFKVHVDGGPRGALTTPDTCGPHKTTTDLTPWTDTGDAHPSSEFTLDEIAGGGPCPNTLAERPFGPAYNAGPQGNTAGQFSPFKLRLDRNDGNQEVKRIDVGLPPGMIARLKGVEYCPEASIDAAAARSGAAELASASCPPGSYVGKSSFDAGSGPAPFNTIGGVYLAGPYKGAPVSLVFVTPAVAGPYDLGNVVVRAALNVDPETAEVRAVSDAIPNVFGGVKLDIRAIDVSLDRARFALNPTTCRRTFWIESTLFGGGGDPANPDMWQALGKADPYQGVNCRALRFKPKFYARIFGGKNQTKRARNPKFRAILDARAGDANLRRAAFILPRATILDQSHIRTICTRVQLAADNCPRNAIYGHATATSPLLDEKLEGPVYLTSSNHKLPDLLVDLRGQVPIRLRGVISSARGRLKTVFYKTPDVAVNKFILVMKGGGRGLLINSRNLCSGQTTGYLNLRAQNSRLMKRNNLRLNIPACRGG